VNWLIFRLIGAFLASGLCLGLAVFALKMGRGKRLNRVFAYSNLSLGIWNVADWTAYLSRHLPYAVYIDRVSYFAGVPVIYFFYLLCLDIAGVSAKAWIVTSLRWVTGVISFLSLTPYVLQEFRITDQKIEEIPGPLFPVFILFFVSFLGYGFYCVLSGYRKAVGAKKNQLRYVVLALFFAFVAGLVYFCSLYSPQVPPIFFVFELFYIILFSYAIVRHRILDITLAFRYGTVYSFLGVALGVPFALLVVWWTHSWVAGLVSFLAPVGGHLLAGRLMPVLTRAIDRLPLFRGKYESFQDLKTVETSIRQSATLAEWTARLVEGIQHVLKPRNIPLLMAGPDLAGLMGAGALPTALQKGQVILRNYLEDSLPAEDVPTARGQMERAEMEIYAPMTDREGTLAAVVALGEKHDRNIWNDLDLTALWSLTRAGEDALRGLLLREEATKRERLAMVGQMASMVSHELKTPLAVIQNSTFFLKSRLEKARDPKLVKHLDNIEAQATSLGSIINGILDYTRSRELRKEGSDINQLIREWVEAWPVGKGVQVELALGKDVPLVEIDREEIKQAVTNLVNNGMEAMEKGGKLGIRTAHVEGKLEISVTDEGKGMTEEEQKRILEPFYTTKEGGTGLGMAVVKKVMDRHGGEIRVRSATGEGTTVTLSLPMTTT
jgi:signal transduction histidine kinase